MTDKTCRFRGIIKNSILSDCADTTIIKDLLNNRLVLKKMKGSGLLRGRINRADRIIFASIQVGDDWYLWPVGVAFKHAYKDVSILKKHVRNSYIEQNLAVIAEQIANNDFIAIREEHSLFEVKEEDANAATEIKKDGELISLGVEQEGVLSMQCPLVLSGAPGTGKTLVILAMMLKLAPSALSELPPKKMLYVANSPLLAKEAERLWLEMSVGSKSNVSFLNLSAGADEFRTDFRGWYDSFKKSKPRRALPKYQFLDDVTSDLLYQEFHIISGYSKQEYELLGKGQSMFTKEYRTALYELFDRYKQYLGNKSNPDFMIEGLGEEYELIVVDESQNVSFAVCRQLAAAAKDGNICFCVDSRQNLNGVKSYIRPFLLQHIASNHCQLEKSYRNSIAISKLANRWVSAITERQGGVSDKNEYARIVPGDSNNPGSVTWYDFKGEKLKELLRKARNSATIVITNQEVIDTYARDKDLKGLVMLLPENVPGMEFDDVLLINPLSAFSEELRPSGKTKTNRPKEDQASLSMADEAIANQFHVMLTRARHNLIINQTGNRKLGALIDYLKGDATFSCTSSSSSSDESREETRVDITQSSSSDGSREETRVDITQRVMDIAHTLISRGHGHQVGDLFNYFGIAAELAPAHTLATMLPLDHINRLRDDFLQSLTHANKKLVATPAGKGQSSSQAKNKVIAPTMSEADRCFAAFFDGEGVKKHWVAILFLPMVIDGLTSCLFEQLINIYRKEYMAYFIGEKLSHLRHALQESGIGKRLIDDKNYPSPLWWLSQSLDALKALTFIMNSKKERVALYQSITYEQLSTCFVVNEGRDTAVCILDKWYESGKGLTFLNEWVNHSQYVSNLSDIKNNLLQAICATGEVEPLKKVLLQWLMNKLIHGLPNQTIFTALKANEAIWNSVNTLFSTYKEGSRFTQALLLMLCQCLPDLSDEDIDCHKELLSKLWTITKKKGSSNQILSEASAILNTRLVLPVGSLTPVDSIVKNEIHRALYNGNVKALKKYALKSISINHLFSDQKTSLMIASENGHLAIVKLLLKKGADVNQPNSWQKTALMCAARQGHLEVVKHLLINGAKVNLQEADGNSALRFATERPRIEIVKLLLNHGADTNLQNSDGLTSLMTTAFNGYIEIVKLLLSHGANINLQNSDGLTALIFAVCKNRLDIVNYLLAQPLVNINLRIKDGMTALALAKRHKFQDIIKVLSEASSTLTTASSSVSSSSSSSLTSVGLFKPSEKNGTKAIPEVRDNDILENISNALINGNISYLRECVSKKININQVVDGKQTSLMIATRKGYFDVVELLLTQPDVNVNLQDNKGWTALMAAVYNGSPDLVNVLLAHANVNVNVNLKQNTGWTALMAAVYNGRPNLVRILLAHANVNVNLQENEGWTPLMLAACRENSEILELLLACADIEVNLQDNDGNTALMTAAFEGHRNVVQLLLAKGADRELQNNDGKTALELAEMKSHQDIISLFSNYESTATTRFS